MKYQDFSTTYINYTCRDCLNAATGLSFKPEDCQHDAYPRQCVVCGDTRYLIRGLHNSGRWKVFFFRPKTKTENNP